MFIYERKRPVLFLAFAPAVLGSVAVLLPMSMLGMVIGIGLLGVAGLVSLIGAWALLMSKAPLGKAHRRVRIGLGIGLAGAAIVVPFSAAPSFLREGGLDGSAIIIAPVVNVAVLGLWFLLSSRPGSVETRESRVTAYVVAAAVGIPAMLYMASMYGDMPRWVRARQADETLRVTARAQQAVESFASSHGGRFPADNAEAGLPAPNALGGRYLISVGVDHGTVTARYGNDPLSTLFGVRDGGSEVVFTPSANPTGVHWLCLTPPSKGMDHCPYEPMDPITAPR